MGTIRKLLKSRWAKIGLAVVCVAVILAIAFFSGSAEGQERGGVFFSGFSSNSAWGGGIAAHGGQGENADPNPLIMQAQQSAGQATQGGNGSGTQDPEQQGSSGEGGTAPGDSQSGGTADSGQPGSGNEGSAPGGLTCTISIRCDTILDNMDKLNNTKTSVVPKDGVILDATVVSFKTNESVFDVLSNLTQEKKIHMSSRFTPLYNSAYIEGINNIYESDCGPLSGWMYKVNGEFPNYGCSQYILKNKDVVEWVYTCDLGKDIGGSNATG